MYAIRECFADHDPLAVLGIVSLIFWSLTLVVVAKYLTFVVRADNHGEGGILALLALAEPQGHTPRLKKTLLLIGLIGSALLFADGVITPAISVLSAIEGLEVVTPAAHNLVVPISVGILIGRFAVQRGGTGALGAFFGPAVLLWFLSIAAGVTGGEALYADLATSAARPFAGLGTASCFRACSSATSVKART